MVFRLTLAALLLTGCPRGGRARRADVDILVVAPHPDDDVVMAGGVMERAVREGKRVAVIVVTNGDFTCARNGWVRQAESIAALAAIGVDEEQVHFLGYPDGAVSRLGKSPLGPMDRATPEGGCEKASGTYANRGAGRVDAHSHRTGHPAEWTSTALTEDLAALLAELRPQEVYITHGIDEHPDHAATYAFFRRALDTLDRVPSVVHRGVVHAGGDCWPGDCVRPPFEPDQVMPPLPPPHQDYAPTERVAIDAYREMELLSLHRSQTGPRPKDDWLAGFARRDEVFYPEGYVRLDGRWQRPPARPPRSAVLGEETTVLTTRATPARRFELSASAERITLLETTGEERRRIARWRRPVPGRVTLQLDQRPEDGAVCELSLWGPEGLLGLEVLTGVDAGELRVSE